MWLVSVHDLGWASGSTHMDDKGLVDVLLGRVGVEVWALDEPEEELVHDLQVRPRELEHGLVLLGVKGVAGRVHLRRYRSEQVGGELRSQGRTKTACQHERTSW